MRPIYCLLLAATLLLTGCVGQIPLVADEAPRLAGRWPLAAEGGDAERLPLGLPGFEPVLETALESNHDVRTALARIEQARASSRIAAAGLFPALNLNGSAQRNDLPERPATEFYSFGGTLAYELDVWGRNRSLAAGGRAALAASESFRDAVRLTVQGDTATAWVRLLSFNDRIATAARNVDTAARLLALLESQKAAGRISALEVARQRNQLAVIRAVLADLRGQRGLVRNQLALLTGVPPDLSPDSERGLREVAVPQPKPGEPAGLLARRPDIRQAELDLAAARANVAAARAAILPRIDLSLRTALQATASGDLIQGSGALTALAASLVQTVFDGGRLRGQAQLTAAQQQERLVRYLQVVLLAQREVADALVAFEAASNQEREHREAAEAAATALRLAELRYREGAEDYTTVLDAERTVFAAETAADNARLARFTALVALARALAVGIE
ncbi:MAG: efflux transporter outer membrane subunit [Burkholderiales bacterium]|jgi:NodT family efflux transporter outer membrane factor (OMF) lipoprotein